jgi:putative flippase GtrA
MRHTVITRESLKRYASFFGVGSLGFMVDVSVLYVLMLANISAFYARIPAIIIAASVTFILNKYVTFAHKKSDKLAQMMRYGAGVALASLINYGVFSGLLLIFPSLKPLFALIIASLSAMLISYYWHATIAFKKEQAV